MSWKKHFLASGVPLEFSVSRILAEQGMAARADFSFLRREGENQKEMSIDIEANYFGPTPNDIRYSLTCAIECKYRTPEKYFIFFPERNDEFSPVTLGGTVLSFDQFVSTKIDLNCFVPFEEQFQFAFKGIEVSEKSAHEQEIRHGINQLGYASPFLLRRALDFSLFSHADDKMIFQRKSL